MSTIVVYGGELPAVCAAAKAAAKCSTATVHVIVPYASGKLGGIATVGGQNYWDIPTNVPAYANSNLPQKGTFSWLYTSPSGYNTEEMCVKLDGALTKYGNRMIIHRGYDVCDYTTVTSPKYMIKTVTIRKVLQDSKKRLYWGSASSQQVITADLFIDASVEGRLARKINSACTTGRFDWPAAYRKNDTTVGYAAKQQAATLMFKMKGITPLATHDNDNHYKSQNGYHTYWGGSNVFTSGSIAVFNEKYASQGYMLKPANAAQNGTNTDEWWINAFLIFGVDGRANNRDQGTKFYPTDQLDGTKTVDDAMADARQFLKDHAVEVETAMHGLKGFEKAKIVLDADGYPSTGEVLYIRETVHMAIQSRYSGATPEDTNYQLGAHEAFLAGAGSTDGNDKANYAHRIGLALYNADVYPYDPIDLQEDGEWIWGYKSFREMRPDMNIEDNTPNHPVYVPYEALITKYVANLLICGYAAGVSSFAWGEVRVFPNLCVLGDAAGIAAAYCATYGLNPYNLGDYEIGKIREWLTSVGARTEK